MNHPCCPTVQVVHTKSSLSLTEESVFFLSVTVTYLLVYFVCRRRLTSSVQLRIIIILNISSSFLNISLMNPCPTLPLTDSVTSTGIHYPALCYVSPLNLVWSTLTFLSLILSLVCCHPQSSFLYVTPSH